MKNATLFILLLLSISLSAQKQMSLESPEFEAYFLDGKNIPKLTGQIVNVDPDTLAGLYLEFRFVSIQLDEEVIPTRVKPDSKGFFVAPLRHAFPYYRVWYELKNEREICAGGVLLNDSLHLQLDFDSLTIQPKPTSRWGITYSGPDALLNQMEDEYSNTLGKSFNTNKMIWSITKARHYQRQEALVHYFEERTLKEEPFLQKYPDQYRAFFESRRQADFYEGLNHLDEPKVSDELFAEYLAYEPLGMTYESFVYYYYLFSFLQTCDKYQRVGRNEISPLRQDLRMFRYIHISESDRAAQFRKCIPKIQTKWLRHYAETELAWLEKQK
ncbi:MAG: hypothetical protein R2792_05315 [Saprospiraceae bacterium]